MRRVGASLRKGTANVKSLLKKSALRGASCLQALSLTGLAVSAIAISAPATAQDFTNVTASGRVVSTSGEPVAGATVVLVSNDQGFSRTTTTDASGAFRIAQVAPGTYTVTIEANGFDKLTDPAVVLTPSSSANQFALAPAGGGGNEIVVTAGRTRIIDFERTTTGAVVNIADLAQRVPVGRDLTSIIKLSPGVASGDTTFGDLASISGASVAENAYYVNGLNVTDFRKGLGSATVPFDFYETVEVKNGGYQAEFGRATGGVVNATTKSGSNEFHASMLFNWQPDELRSDSPDTRNAHDELFVDNSLDKTDRKEVVIQASGPIIKDHLFAYGIYNFRKVETAGGVATADRYDVLKTNDPFWGGKIDFVPSDGHRFEATYFNSEGVQNTDSYDYDPETDAISDFISREVLEYGSENYVGRYTGNMADWLVVSAAYGKSKLRENTLPVDTARPYVLDNRQNPPAIIGNPSNIIEIAEDEREFFRADTDWFFDLFGSHQVRAGYDREKLTSDNRVVYTGDVAYQYYTAASGDIYAPVGTDYVSTRTFISGGNFSTTNESFYIQDNWSLMDSRLQLQLGLRNDRFVNKNADGEAFYSSGNQWGPRAGFTFDVFNDRQAKLYGSFGRYFLPIPSNTNIRLAGAEYDQTAYNVLNGVNADGTPILGAPLVGFNGSGACYDTGIQNCELISDGSANPTNSLVSETLKPQSVDEYILGGEMRFGPRWKFGLYGTYRKLNESLEDSAIDAAVLDYCDAEGIEGCDEIWTGFHQYVLVNPGSDVTVQLSDLINGESTYRTVSFSGDELGYPKAKRTYKAITATFEREFDGKWSLQGSYTYSQTKGNIEGGVKSDNGQDDSGITTDFDQPGLTVGSYGYLPNHRAHNFKVYGAYQLTEWLLLGANAQVASPRKFGCIGRVPRIVDQFAGAYGAEGWFCNLDGDGQVISDPDTPGFVFRNQTVAQGGLTTLSPTPRGSQFNSDWLTELNLSAVFKIPTDKYDASLRFDVFNVFNSKAELDFEERGTLDNGTPRLEYRLPTGYQTPRYVRLQLQLGF